MRRPRGFAAMDPELVKRIAAMGGVAAHRKGTAHEYTAEEAREAGKKGAKVRAARIKARRKIADEDVQV